MKDAMGSESNIVTASISYQEAAAEPLKVVFGAVSGDTAQYSNFDETIWVNSVTRPMTNNRTIKDITGKNFCTLQGQYYSSFASELDRLRSKWGTTGEAGESSAYWSIPTLGTDGEYENKFVTGDDSIATNARPILLIRIDSSTYPETRWACHYLKNVPDGLYKVRILASTGSTNTMHIKYRVNNETRDIETSGSHSYNNNTNWYEFTNVSPVDGEIFIGYTNEPGTVGNTEMRYGSIPICMIEITEL